ncbi:hypothetical protein AVEN_237174-1 [Araneus ventricosus]|uniref:Uncharacterized protein n=1 Tax=Araneus ventricosus TaxID=182803 RepID=A0A4Y2TAZ3_ARAVE|nr:hypothetical protein AVEN_237174-1 [Araneus ventricosus]
MAFLTSTECASMSSMNGNHFSEDEKDNKCVSVPKWIDEFIRDLELHREEVQKHSVLSTSAGPFTSGHQTAAYTRVAPNRKCVQTFLQR